MEPLNEEKRNKTISRFGREAQSKRNNLHLNTKRKTQQDEQKGSSDQDFNDLSIAGE